MEKAKHAKEFSEINRRELAGWKDEVLADWQAKYPPDSPQFILAQYEWSRRLTADQIAATLIAARRSDFVLIVATILGVIVGSVFTFLLKG